MTYPTLKGMRGQILRFYLDSMLKIFSEEDVKNKTQCLELSGNGNRWVNHKYNFDNLGQALMSLFVLSSKDGWVNIMYQGLDAVGIDQQVGSYSRPCLIFFRESLVQTV